MTIQRCKECKKVIGKKWKIESGLCEYHHRKKQQKEYGKEYRQRPEVKERMKINQRNYRTRKEEDALDSFYAL
jgi:hypothetical protein